MIKLRINRTSHQHDGDPSMPILWFVRDEARLTGTKYGCGIAQCGACTVHLDGNPIRSCVTPVAAASGKDITTIEGLKDDKVGSTVQTVWSRMDVVQCGYCQSGQLMSAVALLKKNPKPSDADIDTAMNGNVCRCATYVRIRAAIHEAARALAA